MPRKILASMSPGREGSLLEALRFEDPAERWAALTDRLAENAPGAWEPGYGGVTPLLVACRMDWAEGVAALIEAGAGVEEKDDWGCSPLEAAVSAGSLRAVEALLRRGADPDLGAEIGDDEPSFQRLTGMELAAEEGHEKIYEALKSKGGRSGLSLVFSMKAWRRDEIGEDLALAPLRLGASSRVADDFGLTALHVAADAGDAGASLAAALLSAGADPNARDRDGMTPLELALRCPSVEAPSGRVMAVLLAGGADATALTPSACNWEEEPNFNASAKAALRAWQERERLSESTPGVLPVQMASRARL